MFQHFLSNIGLSVKEQKIYVALATLGVQSALPFHRGIPYEYQESED